MNVLSNKNKFLFCWLLKFLLCWFLKRTRKKKNLITQYPGGIAPLTKSSSSLSSALPPCFLLACLSFFFLASSLRRLRIRFCKMPSPGGTNAVEKCICCIYALLIACIFVRTHILIHSDIRLITQSTACQNRFWEVTNASQLFGLFAIIAQTTWSDQISSKKERKLDSEQKAIILH